MFIDFNDDDGFTLFEILIVMAVVLVISTAGVINLFRLQSVFILRSSADEIRSMVQYGRELAIANKDLASYSLSLSGSVVNLQKNGLEFSRYIIPQKVMINPASFYWSFMPITGGVETCSPCQLLLRSNGINEIINIQTNGIVD
ncbi:hypothetical protein COT86_02370 [Candidatus Collierbacteria bacterium CG10_big_fil_rev_8_21_14_0_10_43_36]|uniref:General secretion pathway GspH domain-containing protein n=1 Tax=Candidatus Collierbacteria bacterium CG10_big_fil_rev_8_21_14_0_10_43_36 TaxID=1974534 RepID=A0A2H0VKV7_9BACT|nr:prepilin-type N-terminal cleavage/methylation domain-containing protein [bacterium]PIR99735.1 MAG: hypothetical protein COT86_02370 [Candidatus Collierbacteria bacterium CG10_big_fil_rev_8_21_14_0_10_43_36]